MNNKCEFRVEQFNPMRVACCRIESESPEPKAFSALAEWAKSQGLPITKETRFFGFNDPCPEPGQMIYTYEAWMTVGDEGNETELVKFKQHPGGHYAVLKTGLPQIGHAWDRLGRSVKASSYRIVSGPALEEALTAPMETAFDDAVMDLFLPIEEALVD